MVVYSRYDDKLLVALLRESDENAFAGIYDRYWKRLFTLAYYRVRSKEEAEDIVHEIMLSLWQRRNVVQIESLSAYLAAAVKYKIFEFLDRKINAERATDLLPADAQPSGLDDAEARFIVPMLQKGIKELPEKCRIVFEYSRFHGKSHAQIAAELQISSKTVEKHINTALRRLRLSFKELLFFFILTFPPGSL